MATFLATGDLGPNRAEPDTIFDGVREALAEGDLIFGQLEPCLAKTGSPLPQARLPMRGDPAGAPAMRRAGFDVISFATNHCMDWGRPCFFETLDHLRANGMQVIGAGKDLTEARRPAFADCGGARIAFLAYNSILPQNYFATDTRPGCVPMRALTVYEPIEHDQPGTPARIHTYALREDLDNLTADVRAAREQADLVFVSMHWGIHFVPAVLADYQREVAHAAIDAGADLILGHHPHLLKPIEVYRGRAIVYSMGNFALEPPFAFAEDLDLHNTAQHRELQAPNEDWKRMPQKPMPPDSYKSMLLGCEIEGGAIRSVWYRPVQLDDDSNPFVQKAGDPAFREIADYMKQICEDQRIDTAFCQRGDRIEIVL